MKGGFNNPPNNLRSAQHTGYSAASMKGGFNNPPNNLALDAAAPPRRRFNEGGVQ